MLKCPKCSKPVSRPSVYVFDDPVECRKLKKELESGGDGFGAACIAGDLLASAKRFERWRDNAHPIPRRKTKGDNDVFVTKDRYFAIWLFFHKERSRPLGVVWSRGCRCRWESDTAAVAAG